MSGSEALAPVEVDHPREYCGVTGVFLPEAANGEVASAVLQALSNLQHRGQDAAGVALYDDDRILQIPGKGLVSEAFHEKTFRGLETATIGVGHTRYATSDGPTITERQWWNAIQPIHKQAGEAGDLALGENGHSDEAPRVAAAHGLDINNFASDTDFKAYLIAERAAELGDVEKAAIDVLPEFSDSAFSMVIMAAGKLIAARDPRGFRPLVWGEFPGGGYMVASEVAGLNAAGIHDWDEVDPGEMIVFDKNGVRSLSIFEAKDPALCLFEFVYTSRPDNVMYGRLVHSARKEMGRELARLYAHELEVDYVTGIPESGVLAAQGFAEASGLPYDDAFVKNRYASRTFIQPTNELRRTGVRAKLNPLRQNVEGKRIAVVDDSRIRGITSDESIVMLREAGAAEVHLFLTSLPYLYPCYYGMETGNAAELSARRNSIAEEALAAQVDSIHYLPLENLRRAVGSEVGNRACTACFTGDYPTDVTVKLGPPRHGDTRLSYP